MRKVAQNQSINFGLHQKFNLEAQMLNFRFSQVPVVWLDPERHEDGVQRIESVVDAYDAMHGNKTLRKCCLSDPELWLQAEHLIDLALINPTPANMRAAEQALIALVKRTAPISRSVRRQIAPETCDESLSLVRSALRAIWPRRIVDEVFRSIGRTAP